MAELTDYEGFRWPLCFGNTEDVSLNKPAFTIKLKKMSFSRSFIFLLLLGAFPNIYSQGNLVPNPSFENYSSCPSAPGQVFMASGWFVSKESPDYYNSCAPQSSLVSVPTNLGGYQQPASGNAYCGLQAYFTSEFREILGCTLADSLTIGMKYFISFKVVRAHGGASGASCGCNKVGGLFTTVAYSFSNPIAINNFAHIFSDSIVKDSLNWTIISGSIIADSAYQFLNIGNFFNDSNTDTAWFGGPGCRAIYFIDDVCVSTDSLTCPMASGMSELTGNSFLPSPNPFTDRISFQNIDAGEIRVRVFQINGGLLKHFIITPAHNKNVTLFLSELVSGPYLMQIITTTRCVSKIIIKN